jgi:hypothetical protein
MTDTAIRLAHPLDPATGAAGQPLLITRLGGAPGDSQRHRGRVSTRGEGSGQ